MTSLRFILAVSAVLLPFAAPVHAACSYNGVDNARTTLAQEFRDSKWVAKVRVVSGRDYFSNNVYPGSLYQLRVLQTFKGKTAGTFRYFTPRDSAGFYFDSGAKHDLGGIYLVFLNPQPWDPETTPEARGTVFVNYTCGQSKPWSQVTAGDLRMLRHLKARLRR